MTQCSTDAIKLKKRGKRFVIADFNGGLRPDKWPDGTTNAQRNRPL